MGEALRVVDWEEKGASGGKRDTAKCWKTSQLMVFDFQSNYHSTGSMHAHSRPLLYPRHIPQMVNWPTAFPCCPWSLQCGHWWYIILYSHCNFQPFMKSLKEKLLYIVLKLHQIAVGHAGPLPLCWNNERENKETDGEHDDCCAKLICTLIAPTTAMLRQKLAPVLFILRHKKCWFVMTEYMPPITMDCRWIIDSWPLMCLGAQTPNIKLACERFNAATYRGANSRSAGPQTQEHPVVSEFQLLSHQPWHQSLSSYTARGFATCPWTPQSNKDSHIFE